jgi:hypothetical protein
MAAGAPGEASLPARQDGVADSATSSGRRPVSCGASWLPSGRKNQSEAGAARQESASARAARQQRGRQAGAWGSLSRCAAASGQRPAASGQTRYDGRQSPRNRHRGPPRRPAVLSSSRPSSRRSLRRTCGSAFHPRAFPEGGGVPLRHAIQCTLPWGFVKCRLDSGADLSANVRSLLPIHERPAERILRGTCFLPRPDGRPGPQGTGRRALPRPGACVEQCQTGARHPAQAPGTAPPSRASPRTPI